MLLFEISGSCLGCSLYYTGDRICSNWAEKAFYFFPPCFSSHWRIEWINLWFRIDAGKRIWVLEEKSNVWVLFVMSYQEFTRRQLNFQMRTPPQGHRILNWGAYFAFAGSFHLSFLIMLVTYCEIWVVMVMCGQKPSALQKLRELYGPHNVGKKKGGQDVTSENWLKCVNFHWSLCKSYFTLHSISFHHSNLVPPSHVTSKNL